MKISKKRKNADSEQWVTFLGLRTTRFLSLVWNTHVIKRLNFDLGQAKMAAYIGQKKNSEEDFTVKPVCVCQYDQVQTAYWF